jgi:hypothetical protein
MLRELVTIARELAPALILSAVLIGYCAAILIASAG